LNKLKKSSDPDLPSFNYFLSHPPIDQRIKNIEKIIRNRNMKIE